MRGLPAGMRPDRGYCAATGKGLRCLRAAGGRDSAAGAGPGPGWLLPARGGFRPRWRRWLWLRGSGSAAVSPSQHPPPGSARAAGPRPERRGRAPTGEGRHLGSAASARAPPLETALAAASRRAPPNAMSKPRCAPVPDPSPAATHASGSQVPER